MAAGELKLRAHHPNNDLPIVTRPDLLARPTRELLNIVHAIAAKGPGFKSLADTWADTTTLHGRLMLTVLGGLAEFERELIRARTGASQGPRRSHVSSVEADAAPVRRGAAALRAGRSAHRYRKDLRCEPHDENEGLRRSVIAFLPRGLWRGPCDRSRLPRP
jgi:Resolvase, N terminal domain